MAQLTKEQIKEIAEQLDCGFKCFWNKKNNQLVFVPGTDRHLEIDLDAWSEELELLNRDSNSFQEINQPESSESFGIMENFINSLSDSNKLKRRLTEALNKRKPFREFKFEIDNSGEYRQIWFDFKSGELQKWVRNQIEK